MNKKKANRIYLWLKASNHEIVRLSVAEIKVKSRLYIAIAILSSYTLI